MAKKPVKRRKPVAPDSTVMDRRVMVRLPPEEERAVVEDIERIATLTSPQPRMNMSDYIRNCLRIARGKYLAADA